MYKPIGSAKNFFLISLSLIFSSCGEDTPVKVAQNAEPPNIIYILTDDLGYGDVGVFYQNQREKTNDRSQPWMSTPNLDRMALEGAMLTNHYTAAPVCAPSRASLLSGLSQGHANVRNNQFDKALADNHTLGNVMQKMGYATAAIGKWGLQGDNRWNENGEAWPAKPTQRGFDYFYGYMRHVDGHEHYPEEGIYRGKKEVWENEKRIDSGLDKSYTTDLWTAAAKRWITKAKKDADTPFFMFLAYDTPHAVLEIPTQRYPEGGGLEGGLQWLGEPGSMINTASGEPDTYLHPEYAEAMYDNDGDRATPEIPWPNTYKRYATSVRRIDNAIGDLIQLLKDLEIDENTLVVFSSDNGPSKESYLPEEYVENNPGFFDSFGPFDGIKRDVLEGGERMPTIVRWPNKIKEHRIVDTPSIAYDWLPTFVEAAGMSAPANSDGVSLLPSLSGDGEQQEGLVYVEYSQNGKTPEYEEFSEKNQLRTRKQMQMIRKGDLVGLRYDILSADDDFEIYDVLKDTHQSNNLAKIDSLQQLQKWMKEKVIKVRRPAGHSERPYDDAPLVAIETEPTEPGVKWKGYEGEFPWLPKMDSMEESDSGIAEKISDIDFNNSDFHMIETFIKVPETHTFVFNLKPESNTLIRIHDATLFDADYGFQSGMELSSEIVLEAGFHPIKIYVKSNRSGKRPFGLNFAKKGDTPQAVAFFHD